MSVCVPTQRDEEARESIRNDIHRDSGLSLIVLVECNSLKIVKNIRSLVGMDIIRTVYSDDENDGNPMVQAIKDDIESEDEDYRPVALAPRPPPPKTTATIAVNSATSKNTTLSSSNAVQNTSSVETDELEDFLGPDSPSLPQPALNNDSTSSISDEQ
ncbi:unnamed protein product [Cyprideis torosa]|uniref:Uncharacterized protein n=1 Tax=Cyprideis torosa TaxID=163714 RepID=A0A7R8WK27_9CRUS|nr:unnamed protein product [Cyprideis torosa]CAG0902605.1 unnamed protein product [Cyprideis torosa]